MAAGADVGLPVAVRPSRREPFTGQRLIVALRECGFRAEDVCFLPTDYTGADEIIRAADLAMVYGGQDVVDKYATDPTVWVNGPGRAKILFTAEQDWRDHLDLIVESICTFGGMACVNTTAVLYEGDAAPLAEAIAERLSCLAAAHHRRACAPARRVTRRRARRREFLSARAEGTTPLLGADHVVADFGDGHRRAATGGSPALRTGSVKFNTELPFPCVWVSPWSREDGLEPLRHSLVITAITDDDDLIDDLSTTRPSRTSTAVRHPTYLQGTAHSA